MSVFYLYNCFLYVFYDKISLSKKGVNLCFTEEIELQKLYQAIFSRRGFFILSIKNY